MTTLSIVATAFALTVFADNVWLRLRLSRLRARIAATERAQANAVRDALSEHATVDGMALPKPDDTRWKPATLTYTDKSGDVTLLTIGDVSVSDSILWIGRSVPGVPTTKETSTYCAAVWKAYRTRVAQKAIDTAT